MTAYEEFFRSVANQAPHGWQSALGDDEACADRVIRIPTGFGKTAGVVLPWMFHRVKRDDNAWPRRLVFCLPMRVLVEQTEGAVKAWVKAAGLDVSVTVLLGGRRETPWLERPEIPAVIIGTQDMLLSRALMRGYGSGRGLWPMEMGMLNCDALWVVDEVQLMDVGLATTTQLHAFRRSDEELGRPTPRPTRTWWMSATLQSSWLDTVDFAPRAGAVLRTSMNSQSRRGGLWDVRKALTVKSDLSTPEEVADTIAAQHSAGTVSLAILNTVDRARKVYEALSKKRFGAELQLVHSRFRGAERRGWDFLRRDAAPPAAGRIIVTTQVVEAGVDLSSRLLVTDLAPWASLVQRFGRCARYEGEAGEVVVIGGLPSDEKKALPYSIAEFESASRALGAIGVDVGPAALETFEERISMADEALLAALYPYQPLHVLRRGDFDDLFDTTPDLSGADLDVGRYIRSGEDRDVSAFWRPVEAAHARELDVEPPGREELCPVPVGELRAFLDRGAAAFCRDYVSGRWKRVERLVPGMTVMLMSAAGGYDLKRGWDAKSAAEVAPIPPTEAASRFEATASSADDEELSESGWKTIATHGREAGEIASDLAKTLGLGDDLRMLLSIVGRWHDAGKAHGTFQAAIRRDTRTAVGGLALRRDLAKAPRDAWRKPAYPEHPGFRHELASTLMMFELLRRSAPEHAGMLGPHRELFEAIGEPVAMPDDAERVRDAALARELAALSAENLDLALYLVCSHHGKVRTSWSSTPNDQRTANGEIHGVSDGDIVEPVRLPLRDGGREELPALRLSLAASALGLNGRYGASWGDRVARLLQRFGPFTLAYLEGVFRVADWKASQLDTPEDA